MFDIVMPSGAVCCDGVQGKDVLGKECGNEDCRRVWKEVEHGKVGSRECRNKAGGNKIKCRSEEWGSEEYESDMSENEEWGGNKEWESGGRETEHWGSEEWGNEEVRKREEWGSDK